MNRVLKILAVIGLFILSTVVGTIVFLLAPIDLPFGLALLVIAAVGAISSSQVAMKQGDMYLEEACVVQSLNETTGLMQMSAWQAGLAASIVLFVLGLFWYF